MTPVAAEERMTESLESLAKAIGEGGALVVCRHDPAASGIAFSAVLPKDKLLWAARLLKEAGYALLDLSAIETAEGFLLTWHFDSFESPGRLALRVLVTREIPSCPSLWPVFQGAEWHEREACDFFGVAFTGNPNLIALLLPEDFDGPPPLRKDPAALAPMAKLGLFGSPEVLDPAWGPLVGLESPAPKAPEPQA
jgi:NADH-quinone oxidoreductase subunit C